MGNNPAATKMFFNAAQIRLHGDGIAAVIGNTKDGEGRRAVHFAASGGSVEVLKYLIQEIGVDIEVRDGTGETPLSLAAIKGRSAAVEYLLEIGVNPEMVDDFSCSPLHHAAVKGHNNVIPLLLSKGINVDITNDFGSPLQYAATAGKHNTKLLLDHGANPNLVFHDTFTPLHASIHSQSWQCAELLPKAGADPNDAPDGIKALPLAAGVTKIIKLLVDAGADPNVKNIRGLKPIELAAVISNREGVEILFTVTSPIPSYDEWSINGIMKHVKSKKFKKKMNRTSTEYFLEVKSRGTNAFQRKEYWLAVYWYSKPNLVFHDTFTPLHVSIQSQSWQCVELLLKAGADPNGAPDGIKALPLAAGVTKIIKLLVDAGADPNVKNIPIELAAVISNREGVEILFPVTSPIPSYDDWSINGIMKHVKSKKFKKKMNRTSTDYFLEVKSRGTDAFQRKEYWLAVFWYSKALSIKPGDAAVLSNRSLCYVYLNKGNLAFEDATLCLLEKPDWPKAFFRAGVALKLLNRIDEAAVAFSDGLKLDSGNRELQDALREVTLDKLKAITVPL